MKRRLPPRRQGARFDTSLAIINIVFLLIFFFLISGRLLSQAPAGMELAETSGLAIERLPPPVLVVNPDGSWALDGTPVSPEFLALALERLSQPVRLHILIGREAPADALLRIVRRADLAGVELRLVTLRRAGSP